MHGVTDGLFAREKKSGAGEKHSMIAMGDRMYTVCSSVSPFVNTVWSMTFLDDSSTGRSIRQCDFHLPGGRDGIALKF
jgi:hypothetical protein